MAPGWARILWFIFIGWWLGLIWVGISLTLMVTIILFPFGAYMISKTWEIMTLQSSPTTVIAEGQGQVGNNSARSGAGKQSVEGKEFFRISPTEFSYLEFGTTKDAKLEYSISDHSGPGINAIVTYKSNLDDFRESTNIGWVESASAVNVETVEQEAVLTPGDYILILDNTGRFGGQEASSEVEVTVDYELIK